MQTVQDFKIFPQYFEAVLSGRKTFVATMDDRNFQVGDILNLMEYDPATGFDGNYTGQSIPAKVTYKLEDALAYGLADGFTILGITLDFEPEAEPATLEEWRSHVRQLFDEVLTNETAWPLQQPLRITYEILREVARRSSELNDPELNALMCRLSLYEISDPSSSGYDKELTTSIIAKGQRKNRT